MISKLYLLQPLLSSRRPEEKIHIAVYQEEWYGLFINYIGL
jgi:hypothetical protein